MYSRSKSSLFQQDFLSSLPNDLIIHFIHFCRSTFTGGVSVKNSSLYSKRPLPFLTWNVVWSFFTQGRERILLLSWIPCLEKSNTPAVFSYWAFQFPTLKVLKKNPKNLCAKQPDVIYYCVRVLQCPTWLSHFQKYFLFGDRHKVLSPCHKTTNCLGVLSTMVLYFLSTLFIENVPQSLKTKPH